MSKQQQQPLLEYLDARIAELQESIDDELDAMENEDGSMFTLRVLERRKADLEQVKQKVIQMRKEIDASICTSYWNSKDGSVVSLRKVRDLVGEPKKQ